MYSQYMLIEVGMDASILLSTRMKIYQYISIKCAVILKPSTCLKKQFLKVK